MRAETVHPDLGELEACRRGDAEAATVAHVEACAVCQRDLEEVEQVRSLVRAEVAGWPRVPEDVDRRMLWAAEQNAARVRRQLARRTVQRWAIAAGVVLTAATAWLWRGSDTGPAPVARLDIVDALVLARQLPTSGSLDRRYDINQDGRVDDVDVEIIARTAVAIGDA